MIKYLATWILDYISNLVRHDTDSCFLTKGQYIESRIRKYWVGHRIIANSQWNRMPLPVFRKSRSIDRVSRWLQYEWSVRGKILTNKRVPNKDSRWTGSWVQEGNVFIHVNYASHISFRLQSTLDSTPLELLSW